MRLLTFLSCALLFTASCKPPEESRFKSIVGAVLIEPGKPPLSRSIIVVSGNRILAAGEQGSVIIPTGSENVDGTGKFVIAAPVTIPSNLPKVTTLAEVQTQADNGAIAMEGMIADTEVLDSALMEKLRGLRIVFVPRLAMHHSDVMRRNTKKLAEAGVLIAADSPGDWDVLKKIGFSPEQILAAATHNAARAAKLEESAGAVRTGFGANLRMLKGNPLEDATNIGKVDRALAGGEWVK